MDRVAVITGASRGIGAATALVLAEKRFRVVVNYRSSAQEADEVVGAVKVGDHFQIPTVGVVADPTHIPLDSPALQALARANECALQLLAEKPSKAVDYVAWFLDRLTREEAQQYYEDYVGPYFVPGRTADLDMAQQAIDAVAAELGIAPVAAEAMYGLAGKSIASI
jgi:NAD(P)-dependent dehydrogenase (short-subunit alcohol dehydrogenase family)